MDGKAVLRAELDRRLHALPVRQRASEETIVNELVQAQPEWAAARTVLVYRDKRPELSVSGVTNGAWRLGKRVVFPRVDGDGLLLHVASAWEQLRPGAFGVLEPDASLPVVGPDEVDVAIVPGVGFTEAGARLGRGGGFYDRLLPGLGGAAWGVAFSCQMVEALPEEAHDQRVDEVWTADRLAV